MWYISSQNDLINLERCIGIAKGERHIVFYYDSEFSFFDDYEDQDKCDKAFKFLINKINPLG